MTTVYRQDRRDHGGFCFVKNYKTEFDEEDGKVLRATIAVKAGIYFLNPRHGVATGNAGSFFQE